MLIWKKITCDITQKSDMKNWINLHEYWKIQLNNQKVVLEDMLDLEEINIMII